MNIQYSDRILICLLDVVVLSLKIYIVVLKGKTSLGDTQLIFRIGYSPCRKKFIRTCRLVTPLDIVRVSVRVQKEDLRTSWRKILDLYQIPVNDHTGRRPIILYKNTQSRFAHCVINN